MPAPARTCSRMLEDCGCVLLPASSNSTHTGNTRACSAQQRTHSRISLHFSPPQPKSHWHTAEALACTQLLCSVSTTKIRMPFKHDTPAVAAAHHAAADDARAQQRAGTPHVAPVAHARALPARQRERQRAVTVTRRCHSHVTITVTSQSQSRVAVTRPLARHTVSCGTRSLGLLQPPVCCVPARSEHKQSCVRGGVEGYRRSTVRCPSSRSRCRRTSGSVSRLRGVSDCSMQGSAAD